MALTIGTNSWVTIAEADSYMSEKWNASATWEALEDSEKTQLLITAYRWINSDDRYEISADEDSDGVKFAQIETGWYIYQYNDEIEKRMSLQAQGVQDFDVSKFSESYKIGVGSRLPDFVGGLLDDFESNTVVTTLTRELD